MHSFSNYKYIQIPIGGRIYTLYVADDLEKRVKGLTEIPFLPRNEGMIFKYKQPVCHSYTMEKTNFPLRIIFINEDFKVVGSYNAKAGQKEEVNPEVDFKYVIEILGK